MSLRLRENFCSRCDIDDTRSIGGKYLVKDTVTLSRRVDDSFPKHMGSSGYASSGCRNVSCLSFASKLAVGDGTGQFADVGLPWWLLIT